MKYGGGGLRDQGTKLLLAGLTAAERPPKVVQRHRDRGHRVSVHGRLNGHGTSPQVVEPPGSSRSTSYVDYDFCDGVDLVFINLDDDFFFNDESLDFM